MHPSTYGLAKPYHCPSRPDAPVPCCPVRGNGQEKYRGPDGVARPHEPARAVSAVERRHENEQPEALAEAAEREEERDLRGREAEPA